MAGVSVEEKPGTQEEEGESNYNMTSLVLKQSRALEAAKAAAHR